MAENGERQPLLGDGKRNINSNNNSGSNGNIYTLNNNRKNAMAEIRKFIKNSGSTGGKGINDSKFKMLFSRAVNDINLVNSNKTMAETNSLADKYRKYRTGSFRPIFSEFYALGLNRNNVNRNSAVNKYAALIGIKAGGAKAFNVSQKAVDNFVNSRLKK